MEYLPLNSTELSSKMNQLALAFPFLKMGSLGKSILGNELPFCMFGTGKKHILLVGTHHGMEWITGILLLRYLFDLCENYQNQKSIFGINLNEIWKQYTLHIVPVLNPDGANYEICGLNEENPIYHRVLSMNNESRDFRKWQANARGVDLNHNYDADFFEYKRIAAENGIASGGPTRFCGEMPESEPEVKALCNHIRFFQEDWKVIATFHSQGEEIYDSSNGIVLPKCRKIASYFAKYSGYEISKAEGMASYSGLTDWCLQKMSIPCFTVECGKGENPLPFSEEKKIYRKLKEPLFRLPTFV